MDTLVMITEIWSRRMTEDRIFMYADAYGLYNTDRTYTFSEDELLGFAKQLYEDACEEIENE